MSHSSKPETGQWDSPDAALYLLNWGTLDRYILKALWIPFLFGVSAFLGISLTLGSLFDLLRKVSEQGLPVHTAIQILGLQVPSFLSLALPMAMLLSCLMVYGRLGRTSEITAFRSLGVSAIRLAIPGLLLGLWVTLLTFALSEFIVPSANVQANQLMNEALHQVKPTFQDKNIFYREFQQDLLSRVFYARRFDGTMMHDLTVLNFTQGMLTQILVTESAQWNAAAEVWDLLKGTAYRLGADALTYQNIETFDHSTLSVSRAPLDLATETRSSEEMGITDLYRRWHLVKATGDTKHTRQLDVRFQSKLSFPFICIVFASVGSALGIQQKQRANPKGFGFSLVIIFGYYTVSFIARSLGEAGVISVFIAAWFPTLLGLALGATLLYQANR